MNIRSAVPQDQPALLDIWLGSVRKTHRFLVEADIQALLPHVQDYLSSPDAGLWVLCTDEGCPIGFMGLAGSSVESLFIAPDQVRRGGGQALLAHARKLATEPLRVDVNEQNPDAVAFYLAAGFTVVSRSPTDDQGRPFPLLHLRENLANAGNCQEDP
ncbi:MAG: GNAT family N-acetyltransferase [Betaproteobacteria bacterium]|nr:GNAT family N-acetyltransferase [Betaproteobacteria bacterium]